MHTHTRYIKIKQIGKTISKNGGRGQLPMIKCWLHHDDIVYTEQKVRILHINASDNVISNFFLMTELQRKWKVITTVENYNNIPFLVSDSSLM